MREGIVITMWDARANLCRDVEAQAREHFGKEVFDSVIPRAIRLAEAPSHGKTIFQHDGSNRAAKAYAALDEPTKQRIEGLRAVHSWERSRIQSNSLPATEEQIRERPAVNHPIVRTHPDTGLKSLYLGNHASHILGWPEEEGRALIRWLEAFATQARFVYSHSWRKGDLTIWDNRCTVHRALQHQNMNAERRVLHRTVVKGTVPY